MEPEDPHLADAMGHLYETVRALNEDRGLRGRHQAEQAKDALRTYIQEREADDGE
jgi:hypothetical protein